MFGQAIKAAARPPIKGKESLSPGLCFWAPLQANLVDVVSGRSATFERTGTAAASALVGDKYVMVPDDVPRFENGWLLLEGPSQNLFTYAVAEGTTVDGLNFKVSGDSQWALYVKTVDGAVAGIDVADSVREGKSSFEVVVTNDGDSSGDIQFGARNDNEATLVLGTSYVLSFAVKSSLSTTATVRVIKNESPYTDVGLNESISLVAGEWQFFSFTFTATESTGARPTVYLGDIGAATYKFDCLQIEQGPVPTSFMPSNGTQWVRPTEAKWGGSTNGVQWAFSGLDPRVLTCLSGEGTMLFEVVPLFDHGTYTAAGAFGADKTLGLVSCKEAETSLMEFSWGVDNPENTDGTNGYGMNVGTFNFSSGDRLVLAANWGSGDRNIYGRKADGTWVAKTGLNFDGDWNAGSFLALHFGNVAPCRYRNLMFWDRKLSQGEIESII